MVWVSRISGAGLYTSLFKAFVTNLNQTGMNHECFALKDV